MNELAAMLAEARECSWREFGREITFYLPGMFTVDGVSGKYPALSITGGDCTLACDHCLGKILEGMIEARTPERLEEKCLHLAREGALGVLISGGCDENGALPWNPLLNAISRIKARTGLFVSVHSGMVSPERAMGLKQAGVDQALMDVIGDDDTLQRVCHLPFGVKRIIRSMEALQHAGIPMVPHVVCGLAHDQIMGDQMRRDPMNRERMKGEKRALEIIASFDVDQMVIVSRMPVPKTPMAGMPLPSAEDVAALIARARLRMPRTRISLGCARQRGYRRMEVLAVEAGVNRMALPSDEAIEKSREYGLTIRYQKTCCSVTEINISPEG